MCCIQDLDPSFTGSRECNLLTVSKHLLIYAFYIQDRDYFGYAILLRYFGLTIYHYVIDQDLAGAIEEEDVGKFTNAIKDFDTITRLV